MSNNDNNNNNDNSTWDHVQNAQLENQNDTQTNVESQEQGNASNGGWNSLPPNTYGNGMPPQQPIWGQQNDEPLIKKHSKVGITSFIIALIAIAFIAMGSAQFNGNLGDLAADKDLVQLFEEYSQNTSASPEELQAKLTDDQIERMGLVVIGAILFLFAIGLGILGFIFGLISVFSRTRRRLFGAIGLALSILSIVLPFIIAGNAISGVVA